MKLRSLLQTGIALSCLGLCNARLLTIPSTLFTESSGEYSLSQLKRIVVDSQYADAVDEKGQTLIPPTLHQFAETFQEDLNSALRLDLKLKTAKKAPKNSIFITIGEDSGFKDAAGRDTSEGYKLEVNDNGIVITGASPLGAWWGTRSLLQAAVLGDSSVAQGSGVDAPGWGTRGAFLDTGRHYYPPEFLIEMCSYLSYFRQNAFHIHLSDNVIWRSNDYDGKYPLENFYGAFRPWSDDPAMEGLNNKRNESYTRSQFEDIQQKCAQRGVTIIPEIEAPAHALVFTQWKPEIALDHDASMLNLSHQETLPTIEAVWKTFLPWFHSKVVHIGADEYESDHIDVYSKFVEDMNDFIRKEAPEKTVRLWGTFTPSQGCNVSRELSYQHWSFGMNNPYWDYIVNGYDVLNSDDTFYMVSKGNDGYPNYADKSLIFNGNPKGGAYAPYTFDTTNFLNNPSRNNPQVLGHISAIWNDYGPNATTVTEAYYMWREVLPAFGNIQWGGDLTEAEFDASFEKVHPAVPAQNLERRIPSKSDVILKYTFDDDNDDDEDDDDDNNNVKDSSGNCYHGTLHGCKVGGSTLHLADGCYLETPLSSKGRNYTLSFSVNPSSETPGFLFEGTDSTLAHGNGTISNTTIIAGGNAYPLNYTLPLDTWTNVSLIGKGPQTFLQVSGGEPMEFKTEVGFLGKYTFWAEIAFEAPLAKIGRGFTGMMRNIELRDG